MWHAGFGPHAAMMGSGSFFWQAFGLHSLGLLVFVGLLVWGISAMNRWHSDKPNHFGGSALDLLGRRYAGGEISRDDYLSMKKELEG